MIFTPENCEKVLSGQKTMTRRVVKDGESLLPEVAVFDAKYFFKWQVGKTYAIQPGRGKKALGRMKITAIRRERLHAISVADCLAEGARADAMIGHRTAFKRIWDGLYANDPVKGWEANPDVWVISFELVA